MIRLFINQDFLSSGLIPNLENVKRHLTSVDIESEIISYENLDQLKTIDLAGITLVRSDLNFGSRNVSQLSMAPEAVRFNKTFDSLTVENGQWLPRLKYFEILRKRIVSQFGNVEIQKCAGLVCNSWVREALVALLVSLGFKTILLFVPDGTEPLGPELGKYFIGVTIKTIPYSELTQNQDITSMIINSVDVEKQITLMNDLAYFNFMSPSGIVVELASKTPIHPLLFEAEKAGLRVMKRRDIVSHYDYESLKGLWSDVESTKKDFFANYLEIETIDQ